MAKPNLVIPMTTIRESMDLYYTYNRRRYEKLLKEVLDLADATEDETLRERIKDCWRISIGIEPWSKQEKQGPCHSGSTKTKPTSP